LVFFGFPVLLFAPRGLVNFNTGRHYDLPNARYKNEKNSSFSLIERAILSAAAMLIFSVEAGPRRGGQMALGCSLLLVRKLLEMILRPKEK
jgi:hypothetical protein